MQAYKRFIELNAKSNIDFDSIHLFKIQKSFSREFFGLFRNPKNLIESLKDITLPFERCFVSFNKSYIYQDVKGTFSITLDNVYLSEASPNRIEMMVFCRKYNGVAEQYEVLVFALEGGMFDIEKRSEALLNTTEGYKLFQAVCETVSEVLLELTTRKYVYVENEESIDVKARGENRKLVRIKQKPKMIIYISDKKTFKKENPNLVSRIVNKPEHSWEVMGHWRKLINPNSLGKNRGGEYMMEGFTWVLPHTRGEGELIKKVRVIR